MSDDKTVFPSVPIAQGVLVDLPLFDFEIDLPLQVNDGATELLNPARDESSISCEKLPR